MRRPALQEPLNRLWRSTPDSLPAPTKGWNAKDPLAKIPAGACTRLDNWLVRPRALQTRYGTGDWCTGLPSAVESLLTYQGPSAIDRKLFAASGGAIYDVTLQGAVGAPVQSGLSSNRWQQVNFTNSAGNFLIIVNGQDLYRYWNGVAWTSVSEFTLDGAPFSTAPLVDVTIHQRRLYFAAANDSSFYYLDAGAISGTLQRYRLGQVFPRGGYLAAIGTWTIDSGSGSDDYFVAISSEGEVAVFQGSNPSSIALWAPIGVYYVGRPVGRRCLFKFGGDLLLLTDNGIYPLSKSLQSADIDRGSAITDNIDDKYTEQTALFFNSFGWEIAHHITEGFLLVNVPGISTVQYVMELTTKGWSQFLGWNASCFRFFGGKLFYGSSGKVVHAYTGASDFGSAIEAVAVTGPEYFSTRGRLKQIPLLRPVFSAKGPFSYSISLLPNFQSILPAKSLKTINVSGSLWGKAKWGVDKWGSGPQTLLSWQTVFNKPAHNHATAVVVQSSTTSVEWVATDLLRSGGNLV